MHGLDAAGDRKLARQTFTEIWNGKELEAIRREFVAVRPGLDCLNCSIRREAADPDDDFFYRKIAKPLYKV